MSFAGFLNVVKPPGMTSHDVVAVIRKQCPRKTKVGHLGTLDPAAAGVLPLAIGEATKLISTLPDLGGQMKGYLAHLQLGVTTSTDDLEGEVLSRSDPRAVAAIKAPELERHLQTFVGESRQVPPQVSAVRQAGKRAYERVRAGETVTLEARRVQIDELRFLGYDPIQSRLKIMLVCGSGTYVRSVARDLGERLGVGGALAFLLRTHSGPFHLQGSVSLEEIRSRGLEELLLPLDFPFVGQAEKAAL